jgi:Type IV secretion-system coupling protein DNA-binding domain
MINLPDDIRARHIYIPGKTQYGKSTLIHWMALQDIHQGKGVCVIDPHGDLVRRLLHHIPDHRVQDTIYLDAANPVPIDFMGWQTERERDMLADDLMVTFQRFSVNWGDRMDAILRYTIYTILEAHASFLDIYHFLASASFRKSLLQRIQQPELLQYWNEQFPHLPKDSTAPITSRMSKFLLTPSLKILLGDASNKINVSEAMDNKKVLLVNLSRVGQEAGDLLGTLLVSKIQQAAMRRQDQKPADRVPFYLYVDEFQHFQTSAFDVILSEAGKYKLCLTLAHQYVDQLDPKIRNSIFGNVSTFILFHLTEKDALSFKGELGQDMLGKPYYPQLVELPIGNAIYRDSRGVVSLIHTPPPPPTSPASHAQAIKNRTMQQYAQPSGQDPDPALESKRDEPVRKPSAFPHER